jgi:hypothetical protein
MFKKATNRNVTANDFPPEPPADELLEDQLAQRFQAATDLNSVVITPEEILKINRPTTEYLCPKAANVFDIEFTRFRVRDFSAVPKTKKSSSSTKSSETIHPPILIDIQRPEGYQESEEEKADPTNGRFVRYHLHKEFLNLKTLGAQITFTVGGEKVAKKFRMIERHYFKEKLIKSFDFNFGAALIPNSENSIEHIYEMPKISDKVKKQMIESPWETKSDSFYFVENRLIMHNKAQYSYNNSQ